MRSLTLGLGLTRGFGRGVPLPAGAGIWSSSGTATASFVGASIGSGTFTSAGAATVTFVGASSGAGQGVFTSAGVATAAFVGSSLVSGTLTSAGAATAAFLGSKLAAGTFTSAGAATAAFVGSSLGTGTVTWNPSDKEAGITLSNGNLTATSSSANQGIRATLARSPSATSYYFEVTIGDVSSAQNSVGLANASLDFTGAGYVGDGSGNSFGWFSGGYLLPETVLVGTFVSGDVIGIELLSASAKLYKNGVLLYTRSSLPSGSLYPAMDISGTGGNTANFGASALAYLPSGATSWSGSSAGPAAPTITLNTTPSSPVVVDTLNFTIDYASPQTTDTIHFEWTDASDTGFSAAVNGDADADPGTGTAPVTFDVGPFASGSYLFRSRVEDVSGNFSTFTTYGPLTITLPATPSLDFSDLLNSQYFPVFPL